jgi:hypothetical protein
MRGHDPQQRRPGQSQALVLRDVLLFIRATDAQAAVISFPDLFPPFSRALPHSCSLSNPQTR